MPGERLLLPGSMARAGHLGKADFCGPWPLAPLSVGGIHLFGATMELLRKSELLVEEHTLASLYWNYEIVISSPPDI